MKATNVTVEQMAKALAKVNKQFKGNLDFEHLEPTKRGADFRLRVKDSHGKGAKLGFSGKHTVAACWHAHGHFFEALLAVEPNAVIVSRGGPGVKITRQGGNWQDCNIGSQVQPMMYSSACECRE